ncbi:hypothetical protein [Methylomicrobium album]|uniref:Methyltransferase, FkbM family n=1 Tax=Methylomicrobium album BG8 TaxID=686340 RepID=H8GNA3_METAL|nr:hypothetical protein [Methylomicrobium album]EIC28332.1 hypothetical protein Metal_0481 [Methylomicrobium album BG8]
MIGYAVSRPFALSVRGQRKTLKAAPSLETPTADTVYISAQWEIDMLQQALTEAWPQANKAELLRIISSATLVRTAGFPVLLGAGAYADPEHQSPPQCLVLQLRSLKAAQPFREHFRLLVINGFGSNLGDTMIGLTAFRQVLSVLCAELPAVSVDLMLGWHKDDRLERLVRNVEGIDTVLTQGLSLAEMSRYQGIFDTSRLLLLPRYGKMPMVDWYLWWFGIEPSQVAAADKRNQVAIPAEADRAVADCLTPKAGPRILVNPRASVLLRSMPESALRRLIEHILSAWPEADVLLTHQMNIHSPRLQFVSKITPTVDHLAALLTQVDGLIGVDTYTQHLADATSTPSVTMMASMELEVYPYYPLGESLLLPGASQLSGWGKAKVAPSDWAAASSHYEMAWEAVDFDAVLSALRRMMAKKQASYRAYPIRFHPEPGPERKLSTRQAVIEGMELDIPIRQREDPLAQLLHQTVIGLGKQVLARGDTVVYLGAGAGAAALPLARMVGGQGRLVAFEPRRELYQLLCANLARAGIRHAEAHFAMPEGEGYAVREIANLSMDDEYLPLSMGNSEQLEPIVCWPLDARKIEACRLLTVCSPLPLLSVLQGAGNTIRRCQPVIVAGVLYWRDVSRLTEFLAGFGYHVRTLEVSDSALPESGIQYAILAAEPPGGTAHIN